MIYISFPGFLRVFAVKDDLGASVNSWFAGRRASIDRQAAEYTKGGWNCQTRGDWKPRGIGSVKPGGIENQGGLKCQTKADWTPFSFLLIVATVWSDLKSPLKPSETNKLKCVRKKKWTKDWHHKPEEEGFFLLKSCNKKIKRWGGNETESMLKEDRRRLSREVVVEHMTQNSNKTFLRKLPKLRCGNIRECWRD